MIKEYEASHGTVADLWHMHLDGQETSLNPLGLAEALMGAMNHAATLHEPDGEDARAILAFTDKLRQVMHEAMVKGQGTRDLCGPSGLTTEQFIEIVDRGLNGEEIKDVTMQKVKNVGAENVDTSAVDAMLG